MDNRMTDRTQISAHYVHDDRHFAFQRQSGLRHYDFARPPIRHLVNWDAIVVFVSVCGLILGIAAVVVFG